jgi:ketosteroid isomerase-like protein
MRLGCRLLPMFEAGMSVRFLSAWLCLALAAAALPPALRANPASERLEVSHALAQMGAAANAHDVEGHVGFYAHDAQVMLVYDGEAIVGWEAIRDKQREWWQGGKTDVVYTVQGKPDFRVLSPTLVMSTLLMKSRRTTAAGAVREGSFAVSSLWQKRAEGWRVIYSHESSTH